MMRVLAAVMSAVLLTACASGGEYSGSSGKTLVVSQRVWSWYKDYVTKISGVNKGVFVVGVDRRGVAVTGSAWYCPEASCMAANAGKWAFDNCRRFGADLECIKFASSADILVNYKIEDE